MKIDPHWVAGFTDGEGTFYVGINPHPEMKTGFQVLPEFRIVQHKRDLKLLYALKAFFKNGVVRKNHDDRYEIRIRSLKALSEVIVPFFQKYPLHTQKKFDFLAFKKVVRLMNEKKHLEESGIKTIFSIIKKMNRAEKDITAQNLDKERVRSS